MPISDIVFVIIGVIDCASIFVLIIRTGVTSRKERFAANPESESKTMTTPSPRIAGDGKKSGATKKLRTT